MARSRQATSRCLSQCWPRSFSLYGVTRPQVLYTWCMHAVGIWRSTKSSSELMLIVEWVHGDIFWIKLQNFYAGMYIPKFRLQPFHLWILNDPIERLTRVNMTTRVCCFRQKKIFPKNAVASSWCQIWFIVCLRVQRRCNNVWVV